MKKLFLAALVGCWFGGHSANAGILLEPYIGYDAMLANYTLGAGAGALNGQSLKIDASGMVFGARLGFDFGMAFVAADYNTGTMKSTIKEQPTGLNQTAEDSTVTGLGLTAGANLGIIRPYLGYIFDSQSKTQTATNIGTGFKVGVGFGVLPKVKLNLEYQTLTITKQKDTAGVETTFSDSTSIKSATVSGLFVGVSVPFDF